MGFLLAKEEAGGLVAAPTGSAESTPACRASWLGISSNGLSIRFLGIPESTGWKTKAEQPSSPCAEHRLPQSNQDSNHSCLMQGHLSLH